jgi:hypothetical protein
MSQHLDAHCENPARGQCRPGGGGIRGLQGAMRQRQHCQVACCNPSYSIWFIAPRVFGWTGIYCFVFSTVDCTLVNPARGHGAKGGVRGGIQRLAKGHSKSGSNAKWLPSIFRRRNAKPLQTWEKRRGRNLLHTSTCFAQTKKHAEGRVRRLTRGKGVGGCAG